MLRRSFFWVAMVLASSACSDSEPEAACEPATCLDYPDLECGKVGDRCGGVIDLVADCGAPGCPEEGICGRLVPLMCGGACRPLRCEDVPFLECGILEDGCGGTINVLEDCGMPDCIAPEQCGVAGANLCEDPCRNRKTCEDYDKEDCGLVPDGCRGSLDLVADCGAPGCLGENTCGGILANQCSPARCAERTCADIGAAVCGTVSDGCGGVIDVATDCGLPGCAGVEICGARTPNQCDDPCQNRLTCDDYPDADCGIVPNGCGGVIDIVTDCGRTGCLGAESCGAGVATPTTCGQDCVGPTPGPFGGGAGTNSFPYVICSPDHLAEMNSEQNAVFRLATDIVLPQNFVPVGTLAAPFTGTFMGNGFTVTATTSTNTARNLWGLFAHTSSASLSGFTLSGANWRTERASDTHLAGLVVGYAESTLISDVHVRESTLTVDQRAISLSGANTGFGLLVGRADNTTINRCSARGTLEDVTNHFVAPLNYGGLVGNNLAGGLFNSYARVQINAPTAANVGGLVGNAELLGTNDSYAQGSIAAEATMGGLFGFWQNSQVSRSYSTVTLLGPEPCFGCGSLVGFSSLGPRTVMNSYAAPSASSAHFVPDETIVQTESGEFSEAQLRAPVMPGATSGALFFGWDVVQGNGDQTWRFGTPTDLPRLFWE